MGGHSSRSVATTVAELKKVPATFATLPRMERDLLTTTWTRTTGRYPHSIGGIMQIKKRALGSSGLEITRVGFGAWAIGGGGWVFGWGPQDDKASQNAMRRAL